MAARLNTEGMLDSYLLEMKQLLEMLQQTVLEQKDNACLEEEAVHEIFRIMHTIKGSSGVMMFDGITVVAHKLEDVFYIIREFHPADVPHLQLIELVLLVVDYITDELERIQNGEASLEDSAEIMAKLEHFLDLIKGKVEAEKEQEMKRRDALVQKFYIAPVSNQKMKYFRAKLDFKEGISLVNIRAYKLVYALKDLAEEVIYSPEELISDESSAEEIKKNGLQILLCTQTKESQLRAFFEQRREISQIELRECTEEEYEKGFEEVKEEDFFFIDLDSTIEEIEARAERTQEKIIFESKQMELVPGDFVIQSKDLGKTKKLVRDAKKKAQQAAYIPVEVEKLDQLMELSEKLNEDSAKEELKEISSELRKLVRSMRMVNLSQTFQKMNRLVFDLSRKLNKDVLLLWEGEEVDVNRKFLEQISDVLMHLVRNAVDHGVEMPIDRLVVGKPEKATVTISAVMEDKMLSLAVSDDGAGLDRQKILEKANKQGILGNEKLECDYTDKEVYQLITVPGFSTKEQISEYSGRGVGMDVVATNISAMGGSLEIESEKGRGTKITMRIPLT